MLESICVIGGINIDMKIRTFEPIISGTSNPGRIFFSSGGVGRNIAHNLALLGADVLLLGGVGNDWYGQKVVSETAFSGVDISRIKTSDIYTTGVYISVDNNIGEMESGYSDMRISDIVDIQYITENLDKINTCNIIIIDTNINSDVIDYLLKCIYKKDIQCIIEPVSCKKSEKLLCLSYKVDFIKPNLQELLHLATLCGCRTTEPLSCCRVLKDKFKNFLVTMGESGVFYYRSEDDYFKTFKSYEIEVKDVNGAGDAFVAGFAYGLCTKKGISHSIKYGTAASCITLMSEKTVSDNISCTNIEKFLSERGENIENV